MSINLEVPLEMLDFGVSSLSTGVNLLPSTYLFLDSDDYDGATYTFEIVASNLHATIDYTVDMYDVTGSAIKATITVPANTTNPKRFRSGSWTPTDATNRTYGVQLAQTAVENHLVVFVARIIVTQVNATKTRIQIPLINGNMLSAFNYVTSIDLTKSLSYVQESYEPTLCKYNYYKKDTSVLSSISNWSLEAILYTTNAATSAYLGLFNATDNTQVTGAEVSVLGTTPTLVSVNFANTAANFDNGDIFEGRIKTSNDTYWAQIQKAALYCRLTNLAKAEIFWRVMRSYQKTVAAVNYPEGRILLDTSILSNPTVYLEASAICADDAEIVFLRDHLTNDSGTDGSEVAGSGLNFNSASKVRIRSGALTSKEHEYNSITNTAIIPSSLTFHFGQTFLAGSSYTLTKVELLMYREGTPPNITVEIQATTAGLPNNTVLATQSIDISKITTDSAGEEVAVVFDTPIALTVGATYAIVVADGYTNNSNRYHWRENTATDSYASGSRCYASNGTTWSAGTYDMAFKNYSTPSEPITDDGRFYAYKALSTNLLTLSNCWVIVDVYGLSPEIIDQPDSQNLYYGNTLDLSVATSVPEVLTYQWYFNDDSHPISGATDDEYTKVSISDSDGGEYYCKVTNDAGTTVSNHAVIQIYPKVLSQPGDTTVLKGQLASFSVTAVGFPSISSYQWYKGDQILAGKTEEELEFYCDFADAGSYKCYVYNGVGDGVYSNPAILTVITNPWRYNLFKLQSDFDRS
jgi:hypothetical protein